MRIDVKTKQDRDTKESRYQKIFERKFRKLMMKEYGHSELNREKIERVIANFPTFDPVLDWDYAPICGCEVYGFEYECDNIKQNRLFERNGHLLYYAPCSEGVENKHSRVVDGYEMWLLEDMRIVFTSFVQMRSISSPDREMMTYRYALGKKIPDAMDAPLNEVLNTVRKRIVLVTSKADEESY